MINLNLWGNQWTSSLVASPALIKLIAFFCVWAIAWLPLAIPLAIQLKWQPFNAFTTEQKLPMLSSLYIIAPLIIWGANHIEGSSFSDYGLVWQSSLFSSLILGFAIAFVGLILIFGLEWRLGWLQWHAENLPRLGSFILPILGLGIWVGITEELIFRGFFLHELLQDYSLVITAVVSSLIFAFLHLIWDFKNTLPQLPGLWLMGMVLVLAVVADGGSLGLAWGLHAGWVWGLSCLDSAELISYPGKVNPWITGVGGQPLAGMAGGLCLLITGAVLLVLK